MRSPLSLRILNLGLTFTLRCFRDATITGSVFRGCGQQEEGTRNFAFLCFSRAIGSGNEKFQGSCVSSYEIYWKQEQESYIMFFLLYFPTSRASATWNSDFPLTFSIPIM